MLGDKLTCKMFYRSSAAFPADVKFANAYIGVDWHGPMAYGGTGGVVEGNTVYDCQNPGYTDTGSTRDVAVRYNYFSDVTNGLYQNFGEPAGVSGARDISLTNGVMPVAGDPTLFEVDTNAGVPAQNYLSPGDIVELTNVFDTDSTVNPSLIFNGVFPVESATSNKFRYRLPSVPSVLPTNPQPSSPLRPRYRSFWSTKRGIIEGNCIDLYQINQYTAITPQGCITVATQKERPGFPGWVYRDNLVRHTDGFAQNLTSVGELSNALRMTGLNGALLHSNLVDVTAPSALQCPQPNIGISSKLNTTMSGSVVRAADIPSSGQPVALDDYSTAIDDALSLCLL